MKELIEQIDEIILDRKILAEAENEEIVQQLFTKYASLMKQLAVVFSTIQSTGSIVDKNVDATLAGALKALNEIKKITKANVNSASGDISGFDLKAELGTINSVLVNQKNKILNDILGKKVAAPVELPPEEPTEEIPFEDEEEVKEEFKPKRKRKIF